jgi:hypothetical protein
MSCAPEDSECWAATDTDSDRCFDHGPQSEPCCIDGVRVRLLSDLNNAQSGEGNAYQSRCEERNHRDFLPPRHLESPDELDWKNHDWYNQYSAFDEKGSSSLLMKSDTTSTAYAVYKLANWPRRLRSFIGHSPLVMDTAKSGQLVTYETKHPMSD